MRIRRRSATKSFERKMAEAGGTADALGTPLRRSGASAAKTHPSHSSLNAKKSVRWSVDGEKLDEETMFPKGRDGPKSPQSPPPPTPQGLRNQLPLCLAVVVGLSGVLIAAENVFDLGLVFPVERLSRLAVPGFCFAFIAYCSAVSLKGTDNQAKRLTSSSAAALACTCFASEALMCCIFEVGAVNLPPWLFSFVVFFSVAVVGAFSSLGAYRVASVVGAVILVRYVACAIFTTIPQTLRPLLGYGFVMLGLLAANRGAVWSWLLTISQVNVAGEHYADVTNHVKPKMVQGLSMGNSNKVIPNRRNSLPIIQKPEGDTVNSRLLKSAESTIDQLLSAPGVPAHILSQLRNLSEILKLPDSPPPLVHRRSKSIPLVTLSGASALSQLCADLPYTTSEESSFSAKRFRRHFSVAGYGLPSTRLLKDCVSFSRHSNHLPAGDLEEPRRSQFQLGRRRYSAAAYPGSTVEGGTQETSPRKSSNTSSRHDSVRSLRISFADDVEVVSYDSDDDIAKTSEPPDVPEGDSEALKQLLEIETLNQWNYPIFELAENAPDTMLSKVAYKIFTELELMQTFEIPVNEFVSFFQELERGYYNMAYHNRIHATDVLHAIYYMTTQPIYGFAQLIPTDDYSSDRPEVRKTSLLSRISESGSYGIMGANFLALELMAMLTAAAMHDYQHPGRTNAFLIATCHPLAVLYNNRSVLENHHAAASWRLLISDAKYAWLANLSDMEFKRFRYLVIDEILVTDLVLHFDMVSKFSAKVNEESGAEINWMAEEDRLFVSKMVIKMADISGPCKSWQLHTQWTNKIAEEFYSQGDEEFNMQLSVSPYMDGDRRQLPKLQESFITHLVAPLCNSLGAAGLLPSYLPETANEDEEDDEAPSNDVVCLMTKHLGENHAEWRQQMNSEARAETEAAASSSS